MTNLPALTPRKLMPGSGKLPPGLRKVTALMLKGHHPEAMTFISEGEYTRGTVVFAPSAVRPRFSVDFAVRQNGFGRGKHA